MTGLRVSGGVVSSVKGVGTGLDLEQVLTPIWDWVVSVPLGGLAKLATYLEPLAFYFSVFLPSLPYTIFMVVIVGWVLAVLQTMLAAPLWAVLHMTPDSTFIGSQRQGYLLLLSLLIRPALAVVGLFAGILVSDPIIDFMAKGFFSMRGAVVASTGTIGAISQFTTFAWWLIVFGATLLPVLYLCFGLPQALPDKVLHWIGGGVHDLGETSALSEMRTGMAHAQSRGSLPVDGKGGGRGNPLPRPKNGDGGGGGGGRGQSGSRGKFRVLSEGGQGVAPSGGIGPGQSPAPPSNASRSLRRLPPMLLTHNPQGTPPAKE